MMVIREFVLALMFCAHMCLQLCDNASCMRKENKLQSTVGTHACFGNAISVPRSSSSSSGNMFALLAKNMGTALAESGEKRQTTLCMYFLAIFPFQLQSNSCCLRALSSQLWQLVTQSSAICGRQSDSQSASHSLSYSICQYAQLQQLVAVTWSKVAHNAFANVVAVALLSSFLSLLLLSVTGWTRCVHLKANSKQTKNQEK